MKVNTTVDIHAIASALGDALAAAGGVAVGVLLIVAAILWFSPGARWKLRRLTLWLVVAAIAAIIVVGYLGIGQGGAT